MTDPHASSGSPVLLTTPEPDPGEGHAMPAAMVSGRLWVNDNGCFQIGEELLLVPHGSTVSVDPPGIQVPGSEFIPTGSEILGGGGHFPLDRTDRAEEFRRFATQRTDGLVFVWSLQVVEPTATRKRPRQPREHPLP